MTDPIKDTEQTTYAEILAEMDTLGLTLRLEAMASNEFGAQPWHAALLREAARRITEKSKT